MLCTSLLPSFTPSTVAVCRCTTFPCLCKYRAVTVLPELSQMAESTPVDRPERRRGAVEGETEWNSL